MGTTPLEAWEAFDKEWNVRVSKDRKYLDDIDEDYRRALHREVWHKLPSYL